MLVLACSAPVLLLGGLYLLATEVLLVPAVPDGTTTPDRVAHFIMHEKGLPRLNRERCEAFLRQQICRLVQDEKFRDRFAAEYRVCSPEEQKAFREHLFDAFKPLVMDDIRGYHELEEAVRQAYLDERIVAYNRMSKLLSGVHVDPGIAGPRDHNEAETLALLVQRTTEEERELGTAYIQALMARVAEILADPELEKEIRARIDAPEA